jgi:hypothetical protein
LVVATLVATVVVGPFWASIDDIGTAVALPAVLLIVSAATSAVWLVRRIHADDVAWREFRARIARQDPSDIG